MTAISNPGPSVGQFDWSQTIRSGHLRRVAVALSAFFVVFEHSVVRADDKLWPTDDRSRTNAEQHLNSDTIDHSQLADGEEQETLVRKFDKNGDGRLDSFERRVARQFLTTQRAATRNGRFPVGPKRNENRYVPETGAKLSPADVRSFPDVALYDPKTLRTLFLEFEDADWERELSDFKNTLVEVPAKLTMDGKIYKDVGVHFRGASSYFGIGEGRKRSLNLSLDFVHKDQRLGGYHTFNLLNAHEDPTFLRAVLYCQIAREYLPAPTANFVRVVINGESWGIYISAQQFNTEFVKEWFGTTKGARWKVLGMPGGRGFAYLGEEVVPYKRVYQIKSKDDPKAWADLINLCKVLNQTPTSALEEALAPILDINGALKFLALENVLINNDGYWVRASDFNLYQDTKGCFHLIPHDVNESFSVPFGPGVGGGLIGPTRIGSRSIASDARDRRANFTEVARQTNSPVVHGIRGRGPFGLDARIGANSVELDPLIVANDAQKPLISKLLAIPAFRKRYLEYVEEIAERWLDWHRLGPLAEQYHSLIAEQVKADTRKLCPTQDFTVGLTNDIPRRGGGLGGGTISLKNFAEQRRAYLLNYCGSLRAER